MKSQFIPNRKLLKQRSKLYTASLRMQFLHESLIRAIDQNLSNASLSAIRDSFRFACESYRVRFDRYCKSFLQITGRDIAEFDSTFLVEEYFWSRTDDY